MALMPPDGQQQRGAQQRGPRETARLGLPDGFKIYSPFPFAGMDQQAARTAIDDHAFYWLENLIKLGNGNLRSVLDNGAAIYTAPIGTKIVSYFFFSLGNDNDLVIIFLDNGTGYQLDTDTGVVTTVSSVPGTFWQAGAPFPACVQWGTQYLLIANNFTANGYWVWDGTLLYQSGSLSPMATLTSAGSGYTSVPNAVVYGGSGTGATVTASIANGAVTGVTVTNAGTGYVAGDVVQLWFDGGGSDRSAILQATITPGATVGNVILTDGGGGFAAGTYALGIAGGGGAGATGVYTVTGAVVTSVSITGGGTGYTGSPTITFPSGGGAGATAIAVLLPGGVVTSVAVIDSGTGFLGTPLISFSGGGGTSATATATVVAGGISAVTVQTGGTGYMSAPAVIVSAGENNAAAGTVAIMPTGVSGAAIETFQSRVWLVVPFQSGTVSNGGTILVSAPESFVDFATSDGGLIFVNSDPFLRAKYVNLKQNNGYLYPFGDSSVSIISNVQTAGSPPSTTFNYQNTDPQIGCGWRDTVQPFGRALVFGNHNGVYGLYGGAVSKISDKMDAVFDGAVFPINAANQPVPGALTPSSAVCFIHERQIYLLLMTITDPFTGTTRPVMAAWDGREWYILSQTTNLTYIATQEVASNMLAFGTDGTSLFQLFIRPTATLGKILSSKLYGAQELFITKMAYGFYCQLADKASPPAGVVLQVTVDNEDASYPMATAPALAAPPPTLPVYAARSGDVPGQTLGCTIRSTSPDFAVLQITLGYYDQAALA